MGAVGLLTAQKAPQSRRNERSPLLLSQRRPLQQKSKLLRQLPQCPWPTTPSVHRAAPRLTLSWRQNWQALLLSPLPTPNCCFYFHPHYPKLTLQILSDSYSYAISPPSFITQRTSAAQKIISDRVLFVISRGLLLVPNVCHLKSTFNFN